MTDENKKKSLRIRVPIKIIKQNRIGSPSRYFKNSGKMNEKDLIDRSIEKDLQLETGNPLEFLKERQDAIEPMGYIKRNSVSRHSSVGSARVLEMHKERFDIPSSSNPRRDTLRRRITARNTFMRVLDYEIQLQTQINDIHQRITQDMEQHSKKLKKLTVNDKILYLKQQKSLRNFEKIQQNWGKIQSGLTKKLKKPMQELLCNKIQSSDFNEEIKDASWRMTLRQNQDSNKIESFIPIGNKLSGLYVRNVISVDKNEHKRTKSCPDLKVLGQSKLPMEIEAIRKPGSRLCSRVDQKQKDNEEIFVENYDFNHKFLAMI
ncbi:hypothetical protein SteCoe_12994 [Stentor coeruleus]|uniref:Uncharacterized protein n=1 Tax=Stentor coeruleus TaxID=5963 RepID=A0A1R2C9K3_9CILI|nr:hypothetical protein SteCoe_12994 [Stentor coeruleus]